MSRPAPKTYDYALALKIKHKAYELGADLVGFANIERFENAPPLMNPRGILPSARTVIVCAIHHPDTTIELDGEQSAHICDSYGVQIAMNDKLDHISFTLACQLEDQGYRSVPIVSSNIWRYKEYKNLGTVFAPDISHIYAAVAAGLSELGWNGLSLTPEYGPRNRFVSIITEAAIEPTPLYRSDKLCDMCGACIKYCPTEAFSKEVHGANNVRIEDKDNRFANKNLWRCAWAEHFALDLDKGVPDVVNEEVILNTVKEQGRRSGTLGTCLKVCVPPNMRTKKPLYTAYTTRQNQFQPTGLPIPRKFIDQAALTAAAYAGDRLTILSAAGAQAKGIDLCEMLPDAKAVLIVSMTYRLDGCAGLEAADRQELVNHYRQEGQRAMVFATLDIARIFDTLGIAAISQSKRMQLRIRETGLLGKLPSDTESCCSTVIVNCEVPELDLPLNGNPARPLSQADEIKTLARNLGANLCGIASSERLNAIAGQLKKLTGDEVLFDAKDQNDLFLPYKPEIETRIRPIYQTGDYLPAGKSVILLGMRYPEAALERAGKPPAEAVGPYVFVQYQVQRELSILAVKIVKAIQESGYQAVFTHDLTHMGTETDSPRGLHSAPINNSIEAVSAGIGQLTWNRTVYTPEYGINQRFVAIITDLPLDADPVQPATINQTCADCRQCVTACPTAAFNAERRQTLNIDGAKYDFLPLDTNRCRWASRYALTNRDGFAANGSTLDLAPPADLTFEVLDQALRQRDPVNKFRPTIVQSCLAVCPLQKPG